MTKTKPLCYLAGPMAKFPDHGRSAYRDEMKRLLEPYFTVLCPAELEAKNPEMAMGAVIAQDLALIQVADMVFVWVDGYSSGTTSEMTYAFNKGKPVIAVFANGFDDAWLRACCTVSVTSIPVLGLCFKFWKDTLPNWPEELKRHASWKRALAAREGIPVAKRHVSEAVRPRVEKSAGRTLAGLPLIEDPKAVGLLGIRFPKRGRKLAAKKKRRPRKRP